MERQRDESEETESRREDSCRYYFGSAFDCLSRTLGQPFAVGAEITEERREVTFRIWNLTLYPVSWSCQLLDGDGRPVSDEYLPAFEAAVKPLMKFGTKVQSIALARPLPTGNYTLRVIFQYEAWGKQKERGVELRFNTR